MYKLLFTVPALLMSIISFTQTNFSGTWLLKDKQAITGPQYANALPRQIKVDQQKDSIIIESINSGNDGKDVNNRQSMGMDGKPFTSVGATSKRKYVRSLEWSPDKKVLTMSTVFYVPENENEVDFTRIETWSLDGSTLSIDKKSVETRSETWETKGVFERQ